MASAMEKFQNLNLHTSKIGYPVPTYGLPSCKTRYP